MQLSGKQQPFAHTDGLSSADSAALLVFLSALGPKNVFLKQPDHLTFDAGWSEDADVRYHECFMFRSPHAAQRSVQRLRPAAGGIRLGVLLQRSPTI